MAWTNGQSGHFAIDTRKATHFVEGAEHIEGKSLSWMRKKGPRAACGSTAKWMEVASPKHPEMVTCGRCRRTRAYKEAARKRERQEKWKRQESYNAMKDAGW